MFLRTIKNPVWGRAIIPKVSGRQPDWFIDHAWFIISVTNICRFRWRMLWELAAETSKEVLLYFWERFFYMSFLEFWSLKMSNGTYHILYQQNYSVRDLFLVCEYSEGHY